MDFRAIITAELDAKRAQAQLNTLTKDQKMELAVELAVKNAQALDNLKSDASALQKLLSNKFHINIDNKQAMQAIKQVQKEAVQAQKKFDKEQQSLSASYYKQVFDNQFKDRHTKSYEQEQLSSWYKQQEKEAVQAQKEMMQIQKRVQDIQKQASSGLFESRNASNQSFLDKYINQDSEALQRARSQIKEIKQLQDSITSGDLDNKSLISTYEQLNTVVEKLRFSMKQVSTEQSKTLAVGVADTSANKVKTYAEANTKALSKYRAELEALEKAYRNMTTQGEKLDLDNQFRNLQSQISAEGLTGRSGLDDFKRAFGQIAQFAGAYGIIQNVMMDVPRQMWSAVRDVDDAMTNLQMATGVSNDQAKELMTTYSQLGDQLKATSTDVAASATEWLKQGQSIENANTLAKYSTILSKIGDLSSEDATSTITAAMKSYDLSVNEVMDFVDQISAVDLVSATDVQGLSVAFNEVAANAKQAGVSTEELLSYAAAIGETTQEGMASVGTSLNAIFSRMGNIKLSRLKDYETGEDLSNVETVLRGVGIQLRDTQDEFRDFDEVLDETAGRWNSFSGVQQRAVAQAFAGTNHMNEFMVLMQQWENVEKYINEADNASGQSMQKYEAYTDSLAGKIEGFTNSFQTFSQTFLSTDLFGVGIDTGTQFLNILTQIIDTAGGLPVALGALTTVLGAKGHGKQSHSLLALHYKVA